jgi:hypothetical protein
MLMVVEHSLLDLAVNYFELRKCSHTSLTKIANIIMISVPWLRQLNLKMKDHFCNSPPKAKKILRSLQEDL